MLLQRWLPEVLYGLESFVSSKDITSGALWLQTLFEQLERSESGILCLTEESLDRNWILFEAGALAQRVGSRTGRVCPLLFEFKTLTFPLAAFQAHVLDRHDESKSKIEMLTLVRTLNKIRPVELCLEEVQLERQFNRCWGEFWTPYLEACQRHLRPHVPSETKAISNEDILAEMRGAIRQIADALTELKRNKSVYVDSDQGETLQQFAVKCPFCERSNEVLIQDRPGQTKPTICSACGSRFNVHMTGAHSVFVRPISPGETMGGPPPVVSERVGCPGCQESFMVDLPVRAGETRTISCPKCNRVVNIHRMVTGEFFVRSAGIPFQRAVENEWKRFLIETQAWIEPEFIPSLISISTEVMALPAESEKLTMYSFRKTISTRLEATRSGVRRAAVNVYIKLLGMGGAFSFATGVKPGWNAPIAVRIDRSSLLLAYARGVIGRVRKKFDVKVADSTEIQKLLFPADMVESEDVVRRVLSENEEIKNEDLTDDGDGE